MTLTDQLNLACEKLVKLQNDPTGINMRDSAWHAQHESDLADATEAALSARQLLTDKAAAVPASGRLIEEDSDDNQEA